MGQKTNPKGFRLISTQKHLSNWYSKKKNYSLILTEDNFFYYYINNFLKNYLILADINIYRIINKFNYNEYINIKINALTPTIKECFQKIILYSIELNYDLFQNKLQLLKKKEFEKSLKLCNFTFNNIGKLFNFIIIHKLILLLRFFFKKFNKFCFISINLIDNIYDNIILINKHICNLLEQRSSIKSIIKEIINDIQENNLTIQGFKIQISGRLNGNDIAHTEWKKDKKMPLHTLNANINYSFQSVKTIYGILGVKIWIYSNN
jgi:small subunit ribosomal protein S3